MILHVLDALAELPVHKVVVVVGHRGEWVTKTLVDHAPHSLSIEFVEQPEQLGTGDALAVGLTALPEALEDDDGDVVVMPGDTPLVRPPTLAALVRHHRSAGAAATLLTAELLDPTGHDRVVRGKDDSVVRVVDDAEVDVDHEEVDEVATTIHCFRHAVLAPALRRLRPTGPRHEHSLTGVYAVLHDAGYRVESLLMADPMEAAGVNDRAQLAVAEAELRDRVNERWMRRGVTMWDPERTYVDTTVQLEPDVVLLPGVVLQGECVLQRRCRGRAGLPPPRHRGGPGIAGDEEHRRARRGGRARPGGALRRAGAGRPRARRSGRGVVFPAGGRFPRMSAGPLGSLRWSGR